MIPKINMIDIPNMPDINFTEELQHDLIGFSIEGFSNVLGFVFWPVFFCGVIAYIYLKNQSAVVAAVAILIIFAGFIGEGIFANVPTFVLLMQLLFAIVITGLFVVFYLKRRNM